MDNLNVENLKEFADMMNANKAKRNGYIMMPSIKGFDLFEISQERLKLYLQAENMNLKANEVQTSNERERLIAFLQWGRTNRYTPLLQDTITEMVDGFLKRD